ncbi:MAG: septum formation initiator family protein [Oscillospiraceae bacterium]|nr:septum formation initiator family protein [Oscillospiraceae bacterium]
MNKKNHPFSHIRIVFRRTSPLMKCVVLTAIVACTVALIALRINIQQNRQRRADLGQQAIQLVQENKALTQNIAKLGTEESIRRIAETELGLVDPDTQLFTPVTPGN